MKKTPLQIAQERIDAYVKAQGMRFSPLRPIVLGKVYELPQPFTAGQLVEACEGELISKPSIYHILQLLIDARILHAFTPQEGAGPTRYELITTSHNNMRFVCEQCGRVVNFRDPVLDNMVKTRHFPNYELRRFSLFVYGTCKKCLTKAAAHSKQ